MKAKKETARVKCISDQTCYCPATRCLGTLQGPSTWMGFWQPCPTRTSVSFSAIPNPTRPTWSPPWQKRNPPENTPCPRCATCPRPTLPTSRSPWPSTSRSLTSGWGWPCSWRRVSSGLRTSPTPPGLPSKPGPISIRLKSSRCKTLSEETTVRSRCMNKLGTCSTVYFYHWKLSKYKLQLVQKNLNAVLSQNCWSTVVQKLQKLIANIFCYFVW